MPLTPSLGETDVLTAVRAFLLQVAPSAMEVVRAQGNRVAMPAGPFIAMTPSTSDDIEFPAQSFTTPEPTSLIVTGAKKYAVQLDIYGTDASGDVASVSASDVAASVVTLMRTQYPQQFMAPNVTPLYCETPRQMPLIDGEQQYEDRWTFSLFVQYNPILTVPQQFADSAVVGIIEVDATYPP